jgi:hypothetical protein
MAEHQWKEPPAGQSRVPVCRVCGARKLPDIANPDHPDHTCVAKPQDHSSYHESEYDPLP